MLNHPFGKFIPFLLLLISFASCQSEDANRAPTLTQAAMLKSVEATQKGQQELHHIIDAGNSILGYFHDTSMVRNVQIMAWDSAFQNRYHRTRSNWVGQVGQSQKAVLKWKTMVDEHLVQLRNSGWQELTKDRILKEKQTAHLQQSALDQLAELGKYNDRLLGLKAHIDTLALPAKPFVPPPPALLQPL